MAEGKARLQDLIRKFPASPAEKQEVIRLSLLAVDDGDLAAVVGALTKGIPARMWSPTSSLSPARIAEENIEYGRYLLLHQLSQELERRQGKTPKARRTKNEPE